MRHLAWVCTALMSISTGSAQTIVRVLGKANPWLSGMPSGSTASKCPDSGADIAPAESPLEVTSLHIGAGQRLAFTASGAVSHDASSAVALNPPDGNGAVVIRHGAGAENGIANITAPVDSMVGVFLGSEMPSLSAAPAALNFSDAASRNFLRLSPALKQPFFIGNGRTSTDQPQVFVAPPGATRLFLGVMDGCGWASNRGSFTVSMSDFEPSLSIRISQVEICWSSVENAMYQVQFRTDLTSDDWTNLREPIAGTGNTSCATDAILPGQAQRTYRVVVLGEQSGLLPLV